MGLRRFLALAVILYTHFLMYFVALVHRMSSTDEHIPCLVRYLSLVRVFFALQASARSCDSRLWCYSIQGSWLQYSDCLQSRRSPYISSQSRTYRANLVRY